MEVSNDNAPYQHLEDIYKKAPYVGLTLERVRRLFKAMPNYDQRHDNFYWFVKFEYESKKQEARDRLSVVNSLRKDSE